MTELHAAVALCISRSHERLFHDSNHVTAVMASGILYRP